MEEIYPQEAFSIVFSGNFFSDVEAVLFFGLIEPFIKNENSYD